MLNIINTVDESRRESLLALLAVSGLHDVSMIEVGSYTGESAKVFISSPLVKNLLCVDTWVGGYDNGDPISNSEYWAVELIFDKIVERSNGKISKFKGTLQQLITQGQKPSPDLIYLDANHIYEVTKQDIKSALELHPKIIAGHDYGMHQQGVIKAVDELFGRPDVLFRDSSWLVRLDDRQAADT